MSGRWLDRRTAREHHIPLSVGIKLPAEEFFHCHRISECFRASVPRRGKCTSNIGKTQAFLSARAGQKFVNEPSIKTVAGSDRIDDPNVNARAMPLVFPLAGDGPASAELDRNDR